MKRLRLLPLLLAVALATTGCKRNYEEFYFKATVVDADMCNTTNYGFYLAVAQPSGLGDTITIQGTRHSNVVRAYRSPRPLKVGETIYGVAYRYANFAALNCLVVPLHELPELCLISVDEDPSVVGE